MAQMKIRLDDDKCLPTRGHPNDAGLDIRSIKQVVIRRDAYETIHTGLYIELPKGHFALVVPRSGIGSKGLRLRNTVGIIDSDYRKEILLMAINKGHDAIVINQYERIAQLVIIPYTYVDLEIVNDLEETNRGEGFGSSGRH